MMNFERIDKRRYSVIKLLGDRLDFESSKELKQHFNFCKQNYIQRVILDISSCRFLTSEGIGLILYMWQFYRHDGKIYYIIRNQEIIEVLKASSVHAEMKYNIFDNLDEAEEHFSEGSPARQYKAKYVSKSKCPSCKSDNIRIYDRGFKKLAKLIKRDSRYICEDCMLVWKW
jgi:anti-anti-sigma regulatory factor